MKARLQVPHNSSIVKTWIILSSLLLILGGSCEDKVIADMTTSIDLSEVDIVMVFQNKAEIALEIDDEEVALIDEMGFVWSEEPEVVLDAPNTEHQFTTTIVEDYVGTLTNLEPATTYFFKAFVKTSVGVMYSDEQELTTIAPEGTTGTVQDVDGNVYRTKVIGGREWMFENLKTMHFQDGTEIPQQITDTEWGELTTPALGWYDYNKIEGFESDAEILDSYGALYNWYAVVDERELCPTSWHVPTDEEWRQLEMSLGMTEAQSLDIEYRGANEGAKIKIQATYPAPHPRWDAGNSSSNSTGFGVIPGGARFENGNYGYKGFFGFLWTSSEVAINDAWGRALEFSKSKINRDIIDKNMGMNIRCIKDDH